MFLRQKLWGKYHSYIEGNFSFLWYFVIVTVALMKGNEEKAEFGNLSHLESSPDWCDSVGGVSAWKVKVTGSIPGQGSLPGLQVQSWL